MRGNASPQSVIDSYKKRQKLIPYLFSGLAIVLVVLGIIIVVMFFSSKGGGSLFPTKIPTVTETATPTATMPSPTASITPTETLTPTPTTSPTASGPQEYVVKDGDNCSAIATTFNVDLAVLLAINNLDYKCSIFPGMKIIIPAPGQKMQTYTPLPSDLPAGTIITYPVQMGDTLTSIASKFNSTVDSILKRNATVIKDPNNIPVGVQLSIIIKLVTPTKTLAPTSTLAGGTPTPPAPTATKTP
jgi:LysM repeat protein